MNPAVLMIAMLAAARTEGPAPAVPMWRCRFCKVDLDGRATDMGDALVHPANACRYGKRGNCAVPASGVKQTGTNYNIVAAPFKPGQRVTVRPPPADAKSECVASDFLGEWVVVFAGSDGAGFYYGLDRPGERRGLLAGLTVEHQFLELSP